MPDTNDPKNLDEASELQPLLDLATSTFNEQLSHPHGIADAAPLLLRRLEAHHEKTRRHRLGLTLGACLAAAAVVVVLQKKPEPIATLVLPQAITFKVQGGAVEEGGYIRATGNGAVTAMFSEGTRVTFAAGSRGRVLSTTPVGGRLSVEQGRADVRVHRRPAAAWVVNAGPYAVEVTGTEFLVDWSPAHEQLELRLREGSVTVRGPFAEAGIGMKAGQTLIITLPAGRILLNRGGLEPDLPDSTSQGQLSVPQERERPQRARTQTIANATPAEEPAAQPSWAEQVAAGDFTAVVRQAEQQGVQRLLQEGSLSDISALADAARYARRSQLAKAALQAQRQRFPQASQSREAVFFLARLAEEESHLSEAQGLYDQYLSAPTRGSYAGEAVGRKMLLAQRQGNEAAALALAKKYLAEYPHGTYAAPARKLVGAR